MSTQAHARKVADFIDTHSAVTGASQPHVH